MIGLYKSEMLKIRTTNTWWLMMIGLAVATGLALVLNLFQANEGLTSTDPPPDTTGQDSLEAQQTQNQFALSRSAAWLASNVFTSGQYFGLLLAMIIGVLVVTNEFFHQTATPTFLTTPKRERVIAAKLGGALTWGIAFAMVTTVISIAVGSIFYAIKGFESQLGDLDVVKAILLNLLAFGVWAIFGLGLGTLLKNQIASIVVALILYLIGQTLVTGVLYLLTLWLDQDWILKINYYLPSTASTIMTSAVKTAPDAPAWWGGMLILLAYGAVAVGLGTVFTKRRDIG